MQQFGTAGTGSEVQTTALALRKFVLICPASTLCSNRHFPSFAFSISAMDRLPHNATESPRTCKLRVRSLANTNCCSRRHNGIGALVGVANYQPACSLRQVKDDFSALLGAVVNEAVKFDR